MHHRRKLIVSVTLRYEKCPGIWENAMIGVAGVQNGKLALGIRSVDV